MFEFAFEGAHKRTRLIRAAATAGRVFEAAKYDVYTSTHQDQVCNVVLGHGYGNFSVHVYYPEKGNPVISLKISTDICDEAIAYFTSYQGMFPDYQDGPIRIMRKRWETLREYGIVILPTGE